MASFGIVRKKFRRRVAKSPGGESLAGNCYNRVQLFYFDKGDGSRNFGDHLSLVLTSKMLSRNDLTLSDQTPSPHRLLGIGSIMHFARVGDVIWGSGINGKINNGEFAAKELDVRAVRGRLTAERLRAKGITVPEVFGDPALLVPHLFGSRFTKNLSRREIFIPNLNDLKYTKNMENVVSPLLGWNYVIERIVSTEFVLSSSLHGLILAEAFGIPCRFVRLSDEESQFKYDDYATGTGREHLEPARSLEHARQLGSHPPPRYDIAPLLAAFPLDLWSR